MRKENGLFAMLEHFPFSKCCITKVIIIMKQEVTISIMNEKLGRKMQHSFVKDIYLFRSKELKIYEYFYSSENISIKESDNKLINFLTDSRNLEK